MLNLVSSQEQFTQKKVFEISGVMIMNKLWLCLRSYMKNYGHMKGASVYHPKC
jgi:hypothetical protein